MGGELTEIRAAAWDQLDAICDGLADRHMTMHTKRIQYQDQGHGLYLIGWEHGKAVGHLHLKWPGWPERPRAKEFQARYGCSMVEDLWVLPDNRGRGLGRALMESAHSHTSQQGIRTVGLSVGIEQGYEAAHHLYRSLGYRDPGHGRFIESSPGWWDVGVFLLKELHESCTFSP
jgi:GNAT superfamily N-acetyltransferase